MTRAYGKWREFAEAYISLRFNGKQAYKSVYGDDLSDNVATVGASKLLRKPNVQEYLRKRFAEKSMKADEVIYHLTDQARAPDTTQFIELRDVYQVDNEGNYRLTGKMLDIDLEEIKAQGLGHLIKSIGQTTGGLKIEWYDAQGALEKIGRAHGIFKEKVEHTGSLSAVRIFIPDNERNDRTG
jgi:hypothetical protein